MPPSPKHSLTNNGEITGRKALGKTSPHHGATVDYAILRLGVMLLVALDGHRATSTGSWQVRRETRMFKHIRDWGTFHLESWMQRGALHQLLIIAVLIGLVAGTAGTLVLTLGGDFAHPRAAIWWAFLRLTDPGYLGDDEGLLLRTVSTVVTVLGYVLFMGSLIAIMTQWLNAKMRTLESGLTPISLRDHILILGWTNRTLAIVREIANAKERAQRFLRRRGVRTLRMVILTEHVSATLRLELRDQFGKSWRYSRIIFRSGSSLRLEHLRRVHAVNAAVVIVPGADFALGAPRPTIPVASRR